MYRVRLLLIAFGLTSPADLDSWREMVQETVPRQADALELQVDLLGTCCLNGEQADALYWAEFYEVPRERWPYLLLEYVKK